MTLLLKNVKQVSSTNELTEHDVFIKDGKIAKIGANIDENGGEVIDCKGLLLAPGFIDVHVHLREPGGEYKETIASGTKAAARGGFTTICSMPNTSPVPDQVDVVEDIFARIERDAVVRVLPYAAITKGLEGKELTNMKDLKKAGVFAFTDDGVGIQTADMMLRAMKEAAAHNMAIVAHCEDNSILYGGVLHDGEVSERLNLPGITSLSESVQIARDVLLAEEADCHYHVCHVSTKESVRVIRDAKRAGIHVTAEVSPHHLLLTEEDILSDDSNFKMNPPLRSKADRDALLTGLLDGTIDFIATDHAPHSEEEKEEGFLHAPFGIVGLETAFPLLYTHLVKENKMSLYQLIKYMASKPADVFGLPYGKIEVNNVADLTLIDLDADRIINKDNFHSKSKNTPFDQWEVNGIPIVTIAKGKVVYKEEEYE